MNKIIVDLNLCGNQIKNVVIDKVTSLPATPIAGRLLYMDAKTEDYPVGIYYGHKAASGVISWVKLLEGSDILNLRQDVFNLDTKVNNTVKFIGSEKLTSLALEQKTLDTYLDEILTASDVTIERNIETGAYTIKQGGTIVGVISKPEDMVVEDGYLTFPTSQDILDYPEQNLDYTRKYLVLIIANADRKKIWIDVADLIDKYTSGDIYIDIDGFTITFNYTSLINTIKSDTAFLGALVNYLVADGVFINEINKQTNSIHISKLFKSDSSDGYNSISIDQADIGAGIDIANYSIAVNAYLKRSDISTAVNFPVEVEWQVNRNTTGGLLNIEIKWNENSDIESISSQLNTLSIRYIYMHIDLVLVKKVKSITI